MKLSNTQKDKEADNDDVMFHELTAITACMCSLAC